MTDTVDSKPVPTAPAVPKEPQERIVVTEHTRVIGGKKFEYTATCGSVVLRDFDYQGDSNDGRTRQNEVRCARESEGE